MSVFSAEARSQRRACCSCKAHRYLWVTYTWTAWWINTLKGNKIKLSKEKRSRMKELQSRRTNECSLILICKFGVWYDKWKCNGKGRKGKKRNKGNVKCYYYGLIVWHKNMLVNDKKEREQKKRNSFLV